MKSMTGYGASLREDKGVSVEASLRAVNGRFFDAKIHLPSEYISFEKEIRDRLAKKVQRGSVSLVVLRKKTKTTASKKVVIDSDLAMQWVKGFRSLSKSLNLKDELSLEALTRFGDIVSVQEDGQIVSGEKKLLLNCVEEALKKLDDEREREGNKLRSDISIKLKKLEEMRSEISDHRVDAQDSIRKKFEKKREEFKTFDSQRLADELVWYLEKSDIEEELTRLEEHLHHFKNLINSAEGQGKKLDFYTQELLREVNTIGSKANHGKIIQAVIESKTLIEQIKEQVQNIE